MSSRCIFHGGANAYVLSRYEDVRHCADEPGVYDQKLCGAD